MQNKHASYIVGGMLLGAVALGPNAAEAVKPDYNSLKAAGITVEQFERNKKQGKYIMPDKDHWSGTLEAGENFDNFADGLQKWAEEFYARKFSKRRFKNAVENYAKERKIVTPTVGALCKGQFETIYMGELEKELEELQSLYNCMEQEIGELKGKYAEHDKIGGLEKRPVPEQKDYSEELNQLRKEIQYLREERQSFISGGYAQPPAVEGYGYGDAIFGEREWFPELPYPYFVLGTSIYCAMPFGNSFYWNHWGWLDDFGYGFRARRRDGRIFDYHGQHSVFRDYYSGRNRSPDGKHWGKGAKDFGLHDRQRRESPREPGRRFDGRRQNDGRLERRGFQKGEAPKMHDGYNKTNQQFNRGMQNQRPQGFPHGGINRSFQGGSHQGNPGRGFGSGGATGHPRSGGGHGMPSQPQSRGRRQ